MHKRTDILTLLLLFVFSSPAFSEPVSGRVYNRTLSRPESGCIVSLIQHGGQGKSVETTTDKAGNFSFDIPPTEGPAPIISASYGNVDYFRSLSEPSGEPLEISVYETTDSDSTIEIVSHHIIVEAQTNEVTQILIVRNNGDRTYRTGEGHGHGLEITLPDGVTEISRGAQGMHTHGATLVSPDPVRPGTSQLMFSFQLPEAGHLHQPVNYPTGAVDVLITPPDITVTSTGLQDLGQVAFEQRNFRRLTGAALAPGQRIDLRISGAGTAPTVVATETDWISQDNLKWILGALALVFALLAVSFRIRPQQAPTKNTPNLQTRRSALLQQIAELDDRFADGKLSEKDYEARRSAFKAEVVELTRALENGGK
ncbi:MAG: hypothetical protein O2954_01660 [bacterium]|nr:hypothetical protein [bacterium]